MDVLKALWAIGSGSVREVHERPSRAGRRQPGGAALPTGGATVAAGDADARRGAGRPRVDGPSAGAAVVGRADPGAELDPRRARDGSAGENPRRGARPDDRG